jgi:hypothetical protein
MVDFSGDIDWQIENIRVTVFIKNPLNTNELESWLEKVSKNTPIQIAKRPTSFLGISKTEDGIIQIAWNSNRIDFVLSSDDPTNKSVISSFSKATEFFDTIFNKIPEISDLTPITRIAIGVVLSVVVENESEGLTKISHHISSLHIDPSSRDFLFRINHPNTSSVNNTVSLNRLVTWSVSVPQLVEVQIGSDGSQSQKVKSEKNPEMRLELDINTDGKVDLDADTSHFIGYLQELQKIALDIIFYGESILIK